MATWKFLFVTEFIYFCCIITFIEVVAAAPETKTAIVGEAVTLPCRTSVLSDAVDWQYQETADQKVDQLAYNGKLINGARERFRMRSDNNGSYDLIIDNMQRNYSGLYTCIEESGIGRKHAIELTVTDVDITISAILGEAVTLPCRTSVVSDAVDWQYQKTADQKVDQLAYNGKLINGARERFRIRSDNNGSYDLMIDNLQKNYTGLYTCIEESGIGRKHVIELRVTGTLILQGKEEVSVNTTVVFRCTINTPLAIRWSYFARGSSRPDVFYNGYRLNPDFSARFSVRRKIFGSDLIIRSFQESDVGVYVCTPTNTSSIRQEFELRTPGTAWKPPVFAETQTSSITTKNSETPQLRSKTSGIDITEHLQWIFPTVMIFLGFLCIIIWKYRKDRSIKQLQQNMAELKSQYGALVKQQRDAEAHRHADVENELDEESYRTIMKLLHVHNKQWDNLVDESKLLDIRWDRV